MGPALQLTLILGAVLAAHGGVYGIPFLYSEIEGIRNNPVVTDLDAFRERMLTPRGLLQRPLSVLSYALNHAVHGERVAGYHAVNVAIHGLNALLVWALARRFFAAPLVAGLVFALHPLSSACTGQIFGRNYSMATAFLLAGILLYMGWRRRGPLRLGHALALLALFALTVSTKQSLAVFPLLLVWYELGRGADPGRPPLQLSPWVTATTGLIALIAAVALVVLYAAPLSATAPISPWTFLMSQLGNLDTLARFYLLPFQTALVHDLVLFRSLAEWPVWLGALAALALTFAAVHWRDRSGGWLVGAILICLLPTQSVLPKNEIIREWRLYPSLPFFSLLVASGFSWATAVTRERGWAPWSTRIIQASLALWLLFFAAALHRQSDAYQSGLSAWRQVLERYPESADAMNNLALHQARAGDLEAARRHLERAALAAPRTSLYWRNLAWVEDELGAADRAFAARELAAEAARRHGVRGMALRFATPSAPPLRSSPARLRAPEHLAGVVPFIGRRNGARFDNLLHRVDSPVLRGPRGPFGLYLDSGAATAETWRTLARDVRGVLTLRESLWAQGDHPVLQRPHALALPVSWIVAAMGDAEAGHRPRPPPAPSADDDETWAALAADPERAFGSFPEHDTLLAWAATRPERLPAPLRPRVHNARASVSALAAHARELSEAAGSGPDAVAARGAELVAASDARYFGAARERVIPSLVANPAVRADLTERDADRFLDAVGKLLAARLGVGDAAIEGFDLAAPADRARIAELLRHASDAPRDDTNLWLLARGGSGSALQHAEVLRTELRERGVDFRRLRLVDTGSEAAAADAHPLARLDAAAAASAAQRAHFLAPVSTDRLAALLGRRGRGQP